MTVLEEAKNYLEIDEDVKFINDGIGYEIVDDNGITTIHYQEIRDAIRGLLALKLNLCKKGEASFKELGYMIDLSRNAVLNMETMKRLIRILAMLGYNQLYLYMEDTYEVQGEPYFGLYRGRYSALELKEIDSYASEYGIEAIPCIQTLAHLGGIFKWKEYQPINDIDNILLVKDERSYELITNMIKSLRACFRSRKIHIGMDEAHNLGLGKYLDRFGYSDRFSIMDYHIKRVNEICKEFDFKPMIWSDMFFRLAFHGDYYANLEVSQEDLNKIPKDIELVYWDYYKTNKNDYDNMILKHKRITNDIRFAGGAWKWMGFAPNNRFSLKTSAAAIESLLENKINKVMVTAWGDDGAEASVFSSLPAVAYYGECSYRGLVSLDDSSLREVFKLVTKCNFNDFVNLDRINEPNGKEVWEHYPNPSKYLLYNDLLSPKFDYMVKPGYNKHYNEVAKELNNMAKRNEGFSYLFTTLANLSEVLAIKAELGINIYRSYKKNDIESLREILSSLRELIRRVEKFYNSFNLEWHKENKPQGFDIQSIRLGGLIFRIKYVYDMIEKYINKEIPTIDELDSERLVDNKKHDNELDYNMWGLVVTANKLVGF